MDGRIKANTSTEQDCQYNALAVGLAVACPVSWKREPMLLAVFVVGTIACDWTGFLVPILEGKE